MCSHTYNYMYINNLKVKSVDKHEKEKQKWHLYKIKQNDYWYTKQTSSMVHWKKWQHHEMSNKKDGNNWSFLFYLSHNDESPKGCSIAIKQFFVIFTERENEKVHRRMSLQIILNFFLCDVNCKFILSSRMQKS